MKPTENKCLVTAKSNLAKDETHIVPFSQITESHVPKPAQLCDIAEPSTDSERIWFATSDLNCCRTPFSLK